MENKLIYNNKTDKIIVLDSDNKVIPNLILDKNIINDIDFNKLPSNILNNVDIYLGKEYECIEFDYQFVYDLLTKNITFDKGKNKYYSNSNFMYHYYEPISRLEISSVNILDVLIAEFKISKSKPFKLLCVNILKKYYNWRIYQYGTMDYITITF